jgi:hypothetical protein
MVFGMSRAVEKTTEVDRFLRMRRCRGPGCGAIFYVCCRCDRGQRYCSAACRAAARRQQLSAANSRYQRSELGRQAHRRRQRAYRERFSKPRVTYQGSRSSPSPRIIHPPGSPKCSFCSFHGVWINPFRLSPARRHSRAKAPRRRPSANGQISTFFDGR